MDVCHINGQGCNKFILNRQVVVNRDKNGQLTLSESYGMLHVMHGCMGTVF